MIEIAIEKLNIETTKLRTLVYNEKFFFFAYPKSKAEKDDGDGDCHCDGDINAKHRVNVNHWTAPKHKSIISLGQCKINFK